MKNITISVYLILSLFNFTCTFSDDDKIKQYPIIGNYVINCFAGYNSLEYQRPGSTSNNVILMNVDSIGWHDSKILAVYENEYFVIDTLSQKISERYKGANEILALKKVFNISDFNLQGLPINIKRSSN